MLFIIILYMIKMMKKKIQREEKENKAKNEERDFSLQSNS